MNDGTRRNLLKLVPLTMVPLAGCSGGGDGSGATPTGPTRSGEPPDQGSPSAEVTSTETPGGTTQGQQPTSTPSDRASVPIGEIVAGDRMSMVVRSVSKTDSLGQFQQAGAGNTYAVVRLVVKNTTQNRYANFRSFLQTKLKDSEGYSYGPSISVTDSAFQGGQLAPGEVARGDVVFEIPEDASGLTLVFDFSAFSFSQYDRVTVDLSSQAGEIADLDQSFQVPIHSLGESVTNDEITVTVNSADFTTSLSEYAQAPEGREYAIVDITTANNTSETVVFSSLLQMGMKDGTGQSYTFSASAVGQLTRAYKGGEVSAGEKTRGKVAYEVPKGVSPLYFTFEYSLISSGSKTFWRLR